MVARRQTGGRRPIAAVKHYVALVVEGHDLTESEAKDPMIPRDYESAVFYRVQTGLKVIACQTGNFGAAGEMHTSEDGGDV